MIDGHVHEIFDYFTLHKIFTLEQKWDLKQTKLRKYKIKFFIVNKYQYIKTFSIYFIIFSEIKLVSRKNDFE